MSKQLLDYFSYAGARKMGELIAHVDMRPHDLTSELLDMNEEGLLQTYGRRNLHDLGQLVTAITLSGHYIHAAQGEQKTTVVTTMMNENRILCDTIVGLSDKGHALANNNRI